MSETKFDKKTAVSLGVAIVAIAIAVTVLARLTVFAPLSPGEASRIRPSVDAVTGEVFEDFHAADGTSMPWKNPKTGKNTLYQAEKCFWTKDGQAKMKPTYVLVNEIAGKPGPTICPDCGRTVVIHNPIPPVELMAAAAKNAGK